ncbi:MAG: peptidase M28, partial [Gemmatimonadota bacterium]|nr:peptidase M28 [Gemmatimonadota bacterium]
MHRSIPAFLLAALLGLGQSANAQTFPTDEPTLRRIWSLGMDSSQTEALAQVLLDSIGPRLTGTDGQKRGNDWLVRTYTSWGIEARNEQSGTWRAWRRGHSHIDLIAPRARSLEGTMLGFSPGTKKKNLDATTIILPRFADSTEFVAWLPMAKGKLVLVSAPQPTCRPTADWTEHGTLESRERMDSLKAQVRREWAGPNVRGTGYSLALGTGELGLRLEAAGVAGILTSRPKDAWGTIEIFDTYNKKAPAVALGCEDYGLVFRLTERNQGPRLRLNLDAELLPDRP